MKIALIANPHSGGKKVSKAIPLVEKGLEDKKIGFDLFVTRYHGHAVELARKLSINEYDAIVSMGGDGTNFQVINGLLKRKGGEETPPIGIIPAGRGNSFARDLNLFSIEGGISALSRQTLKKVDVCRFTQKNNEHYFVNLMGLGFVTDVAETAARFSKAGDMSYVIGVLYRALALKFHEIKLEIDGRIISKKNCFVEFCNSRYTGGEMMIAPEAKIDDGFFDVVIVSPLSRFRLFSTFPKIFKGTHGISKAVEFIKGKTAKIETAPEKTLLPDGEIFGKTPTKVDIMPGLVRYFH